MSQVGSPGRAADASGMTKTIRSALLAAALALLATAAPASAAPAHPDPTHAAPGNFLYLTVTGESRGATHRVLLMCDTSKKPKRVAEACAQLRAARGDIGRIPHRKVLCPMMYAPVTASANGVWNGRVVKYRKQYGNRCELEAKTGAVFTVGR